MMRAREDSQAMAQGPSRPTRNEMPEIACPHTLQNCNPVLASASKLGLKSEDGNCHQTCQKRQSTQLGRRSFFWHICHYKPCPDEIPYRSLGNL